MVTSKEHSPEPATRVCAVGDHKASSSLLGAEGGHQRLTGTRGQKMNNDCSGSLLGVAPIMKLGGLR